MEDFIQFVIKNFYFVLIVLFFLSRLMGKSGGKHGEPRRMPDFGGEEPSRSEAQPKAQERVQQATDQRDTRNASPQTVYRSTLATSTPGTEGGFDEAEHDPYAGAPKSKRKSGSGSAHASSAGSRPSFASLGEGASRSELSAPGARQGISKRELRNAFIWSEVLGPPKAKRNYRK